LNENSIKNARGIWRFEEKSPEIADHRKFVLEFERFFDATLERMQDADTRRYVHGGQTGDVRLAP
jgi:hypothetical protein